MLFLSFTIIPVLIVHLKRRGADSIALEEVEVLEEDVFSPVSRLNIKRYEVVSGKTQCEGDHVIRFNGILREGMLK